MPKWQQTFWFVIEGNAQVSLITWTTALFYSSTHVGNLSERSPWQQSVSTAQGTPLNSFVDGKVKLFGFYPQKKSVVEKHDTWIEPEFWSPPPPPKHQAGLLRHEVRDLVHFLAKGKILFGQSWCWGLQCLRQPLHILLGAFEQMNVNSRSNVTRRKQTPKGNWLGCFVLFFSFSITSVRYCDLRIFRALQPFKETPLMALPVIWWFQCCCVLMSALSTNWTAVVKLPGISHVVQ